MMEVRDATSDDADAIAALNSAAWRVAFREIVSEEFLANHDGAPLGRREVLERLPDDTVQLVAEAEGDVVGWLAAGPCGDDDRDSLTTYGIEACYVTPTYWRRGVGRLLMNELFERLASSSWRDAQLWTPRDTPASHAFYRSLGFETDGQEKDHPLRDGSVIRVVRFARKVAIA